MNPIAIHKQSSQYEQIILTFEAAELFVDRAGFRGSIPRFTNALLTIFRFSSSLLSLSSCTSLSQVTMILSWMNFSFPSSTSLIPPSHQRCTAFPTPLENIPVLILTKHPIQSLVVWSQYRADRLRTNPAPGFTSTKNAA